MVEKRNVGIIDENESTSHLSWYNISKSKDGCYETDNRVAKAIYDVLASQLKPNHLIIDPTAGSGRLLIPFKKGIGCVFGVEFKDSLANRLKHNITKANSRTGDIRDYYRKICDDAGGLGRFDVAIVNPPYGLRMDVEDIKGLDCSRNGESVESQMVIMEMLNDFLTKHGVAVIIIPTSTWNNQKDSKLRNEIFTNYHIEHIITLQKGFKKEYNLDLLTDIVFLRKNNEYYYYGGRSTQLMADVNKHVLSIDNIDDMKDLVAINLPDPSNIDVDNVKNFIKRIPRLDTLSTFDQSENKIQICTRGITGNEAILSLLDFYESTNLDHYNQVMGKPTSIRECYFTLPSLIKVGTSPTQDICKELNIELEFNEANRNKFAKLKKKWDFESTPLYKPKSHELLAYYKHNKYKAKSDLVIEDKTIFLKGHEYFIKPTWIRNNKVIEEKEVINSKGKKTGEIETHSLNRGYLTLEVKSENGIQIYPENDKDKVAEFLEVFDLPDVKGIAELYPERVKNWANVLAKQYPYLFDYQAEDIARLLCKRNIFFGWDMGIGKTLGGFVYAESRKYQRVLIIVQGALVENWLDKGNQFGFKISAIRSHSDIAKLKQRIKKRDFQRHTTEFFVVGQEFLSLDGGKIYNHWTCIKRDKDGKIIHEEVTNKGKCSEGHKYEVMNKECPMCGKNYSEGWTGRYCNACGYRPYSYGKSKSGVGMRQYPAYKQMRKLFTCVITDESQNFAKRSLRGEASRTFKSKSKLMLTGTIMKNYIEDVFLNFGWLLGYENPIYYFNRKDVKRFLDEFGSYELISKSYLKEMGNASYKSRQGGRKKLLPAVSNLNRFWKMISPFTVRRLSEEVAELKVIERQRNYHPLDMDNDHFDLYAEYEGWAKKIIDRELRKENTDQKINLGVISNCLWKLRWVANCPINPNLIVDGNTGEYPNRKLDAKSWNKPEKVLEIVANAKMNDDKVIIFSGLRFMQSFMTSYLREKGFRVKYIGASTNTRKRFAEIKDFENNYDVLVTGNNVLNRGYSITKANHVLFCDFEYTPEVTDQAEFRCIRPGQEKKVHIHYMISAQTIDEQMKETCDMKRKAIKSAIDKINEHADINELMKQKDLRSPEMKIARDIHKKTTLIRKKLVQKVEILPITGNDGGYAKLKEVIDKEVKESLSMDFNDMIIDESVVAKVEKVVAKKRVVKTNNNQIEFDFGFE